MSGDEPSDRAPRTGTAESRDASCRPAPPLQGTAADSLARRPWWWIAAVGLTVSLVVGVGVLTWRFVSAYSGHDRFELIDDPVVAERMTVACAEMTTHVQRISTVATTTQEERVTLVREQNAAVTGMIAQIRGLGPERLAGDRPADAWLADWESLVRARDAYSRLPDLGTRTFEEPITDDGEPVTTRMDSLGVCPVPDVLTTTP